MPCPRKRRTEMYYLDCCFLAWVSELAHLIDKRWQVDLLDLPRDYPLRRWFDQGLTPLGAFHTIATDA